MKCLAVLFLVIGVAYAQEEPIFHGNGFLQKCSGVEKDFSQLTQQEQVDQLLCVGYVAGLRQGLDIANAIPIPDGKSAFCAPDGVTEGQMTRMLLKHIRENPETAHELTGYLLLRALHRAYPCAKSK